MTNQGSLLPPSWLASPSDHAPISAERTVQLIAFLRDIEEHPAVEHALELPWPSVHEIVLLHSRSITRRMTELAALDPAMAAALAANENLPKRMGRDIRARVFRVLTLGLRPDLAPDCGRALAALGRHGFEMGPYIRKRTVDLVLALEAGVADVPLVAIEALVDALVAAPDATPTELQAVSGVIVQSAARVEAVVKNERATTDFLYHLTHVPMRPDVYDRLLEVLYARDDVRGEDWYHERALLGARPKPVARAIRHARGAILRKLFHRLILLSPHDAIAEIEQIPLAQIDSLLPEDLGPLLYHVEDQIRDRALAVLLRFADLSRRRQEGEPLDDPPAASEPGPGPDQLSVSRPLRVG